MELPSAVLTADQAYQWLTMTVVPRPIAWITSIDRQDHVNVAPFSFFTCLSAHPPMIGVTLMSRHGQAKDTLSNILERHEFVVNVVTEDTLPSCNRTAIDAPHEFSEMEYAGLTLTPSVAISVPRLAQSPVHLECRVSTVTRYGMDDQNEHPAHFVVGEVLHFGVDDRIIEEGRVAPDRLQAVGRLSGPYYSTTRDLVKHWRPKYPNDVARPDSD